MGLILLLLYVQLVQAQLFKTRSEIISANGYNYKTGVADNGSKYIYYEEEEKTATGGTFVACNAFYFETCNDGLERCFTKRMYRPSSETNAVVALYKSKFVEIGYMKWEDYETGLLYDVSVRDGFCIITILWDSDK